MNLDDILPRTGPPLAHLLTSWQFIAGAAVLALGPTLTLRRHRAAQDAHSEQERATAAERRGRRLEDQLTMLVAAAAASLSATGLRRVGHREMALNDPFDLLPFVALDIATLVCGRRARRRARTGEGPGLSGALFWILAGTSACFSATEAASLVGAAVRAVWPVLAAVLWELGSLEERRAARSKPGRPDRRLALVRLLHPAEAVRVALVLAARQDLGQDEATAEVRVSRAASRLYRLRRLQEAGKRAGRTTRWAYRILEARADARAQNASERARCAERTVLMQVVARLQLRVRQAELAGMNLRTGAAFEAVLSTLIGTQAPVPTHTVTPHTGQHTTPDSAEKAQAEAGMGSAGELETTRGQNRTGSGSAPADANPVKDGTRVQSDEEVMEAFVRLIPRRPDGRLGWGINKCAAAIGIGTPRAKKFHETQDEWFPGAIARHGTAPGPRPAEQNPQHGPGWAVLQPELHEQSLSDRAPADLAGGAAGIAISDYQQHPGTGLLVPVGAAHT